MRNTILKALFIFSLANMSVAMAATAETSTVENIRRRINTGFVQPVADQLVRLRDTTPGFKIKAGLGATAAGIAVKSEASRPWVRGAGFVTAATGLFITTMGVEEYIGDWLNKKKTQWPTLKWASDKGHALLTRYSPLSPEKTIIVLEAGLGATVVYVCPVYGIKILAGTVLGTDAIRRLIASPQVSATASRGVAASVTAASTAAGGSTDATSVARGVAPRRF